MAEILIVEDDSLQYALIERFVRSEHTVVGHVTTARSAIEFVTEHEPDVAIVDIGLEKGDGLTAAKRIVAATPHTEIIISTARADDRVKRRVQSMPIEGYLIKPYSEQELLDLITAATS